MQRYKNKCIWCNEEVVKDSSEKKPKGHKVPDNIATREHIVPAGQPFNGANSVDNIALACVKCNRDRGYLDDQRELVPHPDALYSLSPSVKRLFMNAYTNFLELAESKT